MRRTTSLGQTRFPYQRLVLACVLGVLAFAGIVALAGWDGGAVSAQRAETEAEPDEIVAQPLRPPEDLRTMPSGWTSSPTFTVLWDNPASLVITGARYTVDITPTNNVSGLLAVADDITRVADITLPNRFDGGHPVWVWLVDEDGNLDHTASASTTYLYDGTPPTVELEAPTFVTAPSFTVTWSGDDGAFGADVLSYSVDYLESGATTWIHWLSQTTLTQSNFVSGTLGRSYVFSVTARDRAGNTAQDVTTVRVGNYSIYIPLVLRSYPPLANGGFETGMLAPGWGAVRGGFEGHGSGLDTEVVEPEDDATPYEGQYSALIGDPNGVDGALSVGFGGIVQEIAVASPNIQVAYRVVTHDLYRGANDLYYDGLEVSINTPPETVTDAERIDKCGEGSINPTGLITATEGLVFCGGRYGSPSDLGEKWDSDWMTVTLDVSAFQDDTIDLYLAVWGREHLESYRDDEGSFNT
ncbi:MAG: hypothetical protein ACP5JG_06920, partial [Anaerolineae bacterium]